MESLEALIAKMNPLFEANARAPHAAPREGAELRLHQLDRSGINAHLPKRAAGVIANGLHHETDPVRVVRAWLREASAKPYLVLCGTTGVGKTWALAEAVAALGGVYTTANDTRRMWASRQRDGAPQTHEDAEKAWMAIARAKFVALDELGQADDGDWKAALREQRGAFHALVDTRQDRPTLVATNVSRADLGAAFVNGTLDPRTKSRLGPLVYRTPKGHPVFDFAGKDLRGGWEAT